MTLPARLLALITIHHLKGTNGIIMIAADDNLSVRCKNRSANDGFRPRGSRIHDVPRDLSVLDVTIAALSGCSIRSFSNPQLPLYG